MNLSVETKLKSLGLALPEVITPRGSFKPFVIAGSMIYLSGKGLPARAEMPHIPKVGAEVSTAEAQVYARDIALYMLAVVKLAIGDLDRIKQVVKVLGMVNATPNFVGHTEVINGCSDLLVQVLGEKGEHARSAVGVGSLPRGFAVEIEAIFEFI
jgi:enamine deaminase RidA (YjgF/YER057c/UK114 family)